MTYLKIALCALCLSITALTVPASPNKQQDKDTTDGTFLALPVAGALGVVQGITWPIRDLVYLALSMAQKAEGYLDATLIKNPTISSFVDAPGLRKMFYAVGYTSGLAIFFAAPYFLLTTYKQKVYCYILLTLLVAIIAHQVHDSHLDKLQKVVQGSKT